ncbi:MAG: NUDIX hydrolase [Tepidiformaceae bacterium]
MPLFDLYASVVLWRGDDILVMKRGTGGFSAGGWFFPGGHVEAGERPIEACARELFEETEIPLEASALTLVDVMTFETGSKASPTAHTIIYTAACGAGTEPMINDEHLTARWMAPEAYIARFLDGAMLRERGVPESAVLLAEEVARVTRAAAAMRGR